MYRTCFITFLFVQCVTTLWFKELERPKKLFCRICPLYCRPKMEEKQAAKPEAKSDYTPVWYVDGDGPFLFDYFDQIEKWSFHKWPTPPSTTTTTTTTAPPTTEGPSGICILCLLKCDYPKP